MNNKTNKKTTRKKVLDMRPFALELHNDVGDGNCRICEQWRTIDANDLCVACWERRLEALEG